MKQVRTALAGAVAVAFTQLAPAQGMSAERSYEAPYPASGDRQQQQPVTKNARNRHGDRTVRGEDDPPRNDWRYPGKPEGDG